MPDGPRRIAVLSSSDAEIVCALGAGDRLVARMAYCDHPPEVRRLPSVGSFITVNGEKLAALRPDLVLCTSYLQRDIVKEVMDRDLNVLALTPFTLEDIFQNILILGLALDRAEAARNLVAGLRKDLAVITAAAAALPHRPSYYFDEWGPEDQLYQGKFFLAGDWRTEMADLAGGVNVFGDRKTRVRCTHPDRLTTVEEIATRDPDVILITWPGRTEQATPARLARRKGWRELRAVREKHIYPIDDHLTMRGGPRVVEGIRRIQEAFSAAAGAPRGPGHA